MFNIPISGSERKEEMDECEERVDMPAGLYACLVNEKSLCCNMWQTVGSRRIYGIKMFMINAC